MPRSVYRQSAGNPIQRHLLPQARLDLEFAYHRGVDNDDDAFTWKVICELALTSFLGLVCCWLLLCVFDMTVFVMLFSGFAIAFGWRTMKPHVVAIHDVSIAVIAAVWVCHLIPFPAVVDVYVALTATAIIGREVARHYAFVATVSPASIEQSWAERQGVCWQTLVSSLLLLPLAVGVIVPQFLPVLMALGVIGWIALTSIYIRNWNTYLDGCWEAFKCWCSYNRDEHALPGILVSPSGDCRKRLTMLVAANLLNVFAIFRITSDFQVSQGMSRFGSFLSSSSFPELIVNLVLLALLCAVVAMLPLLLVLFSICVIGTPVFGRLAIPKPSFVPATEWQKITDTIRQSSNEIEAESLYVGRVVYDQSPVLVPKEIFQEHAHFLGDSGSGKTARGLAPFIEQVIGSGNASVMVLDLKGDSPELLQTLKSGAAAARAIAKVDVPLRYFTPRDDKATYGFNPFTLACWDSLNTLQKTDVLCGALGLIYGSDYGEGYFSSANASVLFTTMTQFPDVRNFEQLRDRLTYIVSNSKRHGLDDKSRDAGNHVKMSVTRLASIPALNITDSFTPDELVPRNCIDPARLFQHPEAHYYSLSATLGPGSSPEIARFATFMLMTASTLTTRTVPVYLIIDEFQRMAARNLDYLLQLARSMGVAVILANQSMEDLRRYDLTSTLETNCRYRQWFAISGWDDQDRLSRASGETVDTIDSMSVSQSISDRGNTTSASRSRQDFIAPRLTKNDIKLVSDDDRKSVVLINRGAGYAQYGGMPVVIESDFHISKDEYKARKDAPWPSTDEGTFVPSEWKRPDPEVPHRGRKQNTAPPISKETINVGPAPKSSRNTQQTKPNKRRRGKTKVATAVPESAPSVDLFDRYLREKPIGPADGNSDEGTE